MNIINLNKNDINKKLTTLEHASAFESKETIHSELLAYFLLNESDFLKKFLELADYKAKNLQNITAKTEENHIDVIVENEEFVLIIENKYKDRNRTDKDSDNKENDNKHLKEQLKRYENLIMRTKTSTRNVFVYLRPFMHDLNNKLWKTLTYKDVLNIIENTKTNNEFNRYKKILKKIYKPQEICISALKEVMSFDDKTIDDKRGDINGYSIEIPLKSFNSNYNSFVQFEHFEPTEKRGQITINLTVKKSIATDEDKKLLGKVAESLKQEINNEYEWVTETICKNYDFSEDLVKEKIKNSKIINTLAQNNIF